MPDKAPTPQAGVTVIENVSLEAFERAVYARDHEQAGGLLIQALRRFKAGGLFIGYSTQPAVQAMLYTRFAAAVVALIADPQFSLSQDGFDMLAAEHASLDLVFRASAFETADHLLPQVAANPEASDPGKLQFKDGAALVKFLPAYSLRSGLSLDFAATFSKSPQMSVSLWAGMLSALLTTAVQAHERREALLGLHGLFAGVRIPDAIMPTLADAYMYASYGARRDKHDAKATIHALFARALQGHGAAIPSAADLAARTAGRKPGAKPTLLVCCEWFTSVHAMFRCYAPIIRQLRSHFHVVGMSRAQDIDAGGKAEFDEWREVPADLNLRELVNRVNAIAPEVIYYPSLGMAMWWVALASVRMAPLQIMTLGHPASSRSPCMDVVLCDEGAIGDPALFTERIVEYPNGSARYVARPDATWPAVQREDTPETVHVAVPAMLCKLNAPFMAVLRDIDTRSIRPVQWHFFPNMMGLNLHQATREIRDWLPGAKVYERAHFNDYLAALAQCHLHLCSFPFGGTNSNIDSMMLGIPLVTLLGDQPHERFDAQMIRRAGLPEALVTRTPEDYAAQAIRLIDDHAARNALRDHLLCFDLKAAFFDPPPEDQRTAFVDAVWGVYLEGRDG
jgi:hypothetical protein